jgi:hypothetical protein
MLCTIINVDKKNKLDNHPQNPLSTHLHPYCQCRRSCLPCALDHLPRRTICRYHHHQWIKGQAYWRWPLLDGPGQSARVELRLRLAQLDGPATAAIGRTGAIQQLISLLETGGMHGKKDTVAK